MARGNNVTRIDEKGRLKLPANFKSELEGGGEGKQVFYVTSRDGKRAEIWPIKAWQEIEGRLAKIPSMSSARKKFLDRTNYYGQVTEMDNQGRLLIPQLLRESAQLVGDVVVFGVLNYFEVANHEKFKAEMEAAPMSAAEEAELAMHGI